MERGTGADPSVRSTPWRLLIVAVGLAAAAIRVILIAGGFPLAGDEGGADLQIYYYFSDLVREGINPYDAPVDGTIDRVYGDNPPFHLLAFAAVLELHDSTDSLRAVFVMADFTLILTVGIWYPRSRAWRAGFVTFYGFNPFVLLSWTWTAEDKTILLLLITLVLLGLDRGRLALSWVATTILGVFKWIAVGFIVPLAICMARERSQRRALGAALLFVGLIVASQLPWFPDSLTAFERRSERVGFDPPTHSSPTILVARAGLYDPLIAYALGPVCMLMVYGLYLIRRISVQEAIVLVFFFSYVFLPDQSYTRVLLIALPFLFIVEMTVRRWAIVWAASLMSAAALSVQLGAVTLPWLQSLVGEYGSARHAIEMNLLLVILVLCYLGDSYGSGRLRWRRGLTESSDQAA